MARWLSSLLAGAVAFLPGPASGQPGALERHTAIHDAPRERMVVFGGGIGGAQFSNEVWELPLTRIPAWASLSPSGSPPSKRLGHSAIYDPVRDRMIVFGGIDSSGAVIGDVWALSLPDPPAWAPLLPSGTAPGPRSYHSAVYDPLRDRVVVFGGQDASRTAQQDVWSLWLAPEPRWSRMTPGGTLPPRRFSHAAIYDPPRDRMVVFSGGGFATNDLWSLALADSAWVQLHPSGNPPLARRGHTATYDPSLDRVVVFGGDTGLQPLNDTWELSLVATTAWSPMIAAGIAPTPRAYHAAVPDAENGRMVFFGGTPNVTEPTWALALGSPGRWSPFRPELEVLPGGIALPTVTLGDTASVRFLVSNTGMQPLQVTSLLVSSPEMWLRPPGPFELAWGEAVTETLVLAASEAGTLNDSVVIVSSDPLVPRRQVALSGDVRPLEFDTRVLDSNPEVPLGVSFVVVVTPRPGVRVERGLLYYRIADGRSGFDSTPLSPLATDFIATVPASAVTEHGVEYYARVENSGFTATQPPTAPTAVLFQLVAAADSLTAVPRPTSGAEFLEGRDIEVEAVLPAGAKFESGALHYRPGGDAGDESVALAMNVLGRPVATIPGSAVGPRGVEYWMEATTVLGALRFPSASATTAQLRVRVQDLVEPSEHPGSRYRLLSVPLDFGADFSGGLDALLTDQLGRYDPMGWRAYWYDPAAAGNIEFSAAPTETFRPEPGRAFWLISRGAHRVDTKPVPGSSTPTEDDYAIPLAAGWNLFGNPFAFPVAWSDVQRDPLVVSDPVAFDPALGTIGDYADLAPAVLAPFEGYFVYATEPATVTVPPRAAPVPALALPAPRPARAPAPPASRAATGELWSFRVRVFTDQAVDGSNVFGVSLAAAAGRDPLDGPKPSAPPGPWVRVAFAHPEWGGASAYRRDLRGPDTEGDTWELEARSSSPGEIIALEISEIVPAPPGLVVRLIDREQGSAPEGLRYRIVSMGDRPYRLAIVAGTGAYVAEVMQRTVALPGRMTLEPAAPSPFRLATRLRFGLPRATLARVEIYNLLGQRVAEPLVRAPLPPGYHTAVWDGRTTRGDRAPSGVYFVRLTAEREVLTRRVVLTR